MYPGRISAMPDHTRPQGDADTSQTPSGGSIPMPDLDSAELYLNREINWLEFNARVLEETLNPDHPLLWIN